MRLLFKTLPLLLSAATGAAQASPETLAQGEALVRESCAGCHAVGLDDVSPNPLSPPFRTLGRKYPIEHLAESFAEGISVGHEGMPEFILEPDQIEALLGYLASIQR